MKKLKTFSRSPMGTLFMFMLAVLFLMTGTIGGVRAAPQIFNENSGYGGIQLDAIGVSLYEKTENNAAEKVGSRDYSRDYSNDNTSKEDFANGGTHVLLAKLLGSDDQIQLGRKYNEQLYVKNTGNIPEFVRVTIYKYWTDSSGNKTEATDKLSPDLIDLHLVTGGEWIVDTRPGSRTRERTVLYRTSVLNPNAESDIFADTLTLDSRIIDLVDVKTSTTTTTSDGKTITESITWLAEDGYQFWIEVEVDAVQNHNAKDAVRSAWGLMESDAVYTAIDF